MPQDSVGVHGGQLTFNEAAPCDSETSRVYMHSIWQLPERALLALGLPGRTLTKQLLTQESQNRLPWYPFGSHFAECNLVNLKQCHVALLTTAVTETLGLPVRIQAKQLLIHQIHHREGLVDLPVVHILLLHAGPCQGYWHC